MSENKKYTIKKIEAAIRQLDVAITLWFHEGDEIAIHTLACSAHEIIHDINYHRKGQELLFDSPYINDKYRKDAIYHLSKPYNFFKHAKHDPDPEGTIELDSFLTEGFILAASIGLESLGIKPNSFRIAFTRYQMIHTPSIFREDTIKHIPVDFLALIRNINRIHFYEYSTAKPQLFGEFFSF
jgi:hypothetical protein